ncbi:MAG TPA: hypothetical protein VM686_16065, partial [Polyangiaceae bacterium]|nr:hypothetical protein [Polyangiaceae bacterium]
PEGNLEVTNVGLTAYDIDGENNPDLTLCRGNTYTFQVDALGHPFFIKTEPGIGEANQFTDGVTNNGEDNGDVEFAVPNDAPDELHYNCGVHAAMTGTLTIVD